MLHRHHKIPRHAGGTDDPENIEMLTVAELQRRTACCLSSMGDGKTRLRGTRAKISKTRLGREMPQMSTDHKAKIVAAAKKPKSEETKRKMAAARKAYWERKKS